MLVPLAVLALAVSPPPAGATLPDGEGLEPTTAGPLPAWRWPVAPAEPLRRFAVSADPFARGQHRGADLPAPTGTPVRAACAGRVRFAGTVGASGRTVSVECGRLTATYLHLGRVEVRPAARVAKGAVLGTVGTSGRPRDDRPHLHLGAKVTATGRYVDPLRLLHGGPSPPASPPPAAPPTRPPALGPAPRSAPARASDARPAPAPGARAAEVLRPVPGRPRAAPAPAPPSRVPPPAWAGLVLAAAGVPLGGLVTLRRRRRAAARARSGAPVAPV